MPRHIETAKPSQPENENRDVEFEENKNALLQYEKIWEDGERAQHLYDVVSQKYDNNQTDFFSPENLDDLSEYSCSERLAMFSAVAKDLRISTQMAKKYFDKYPEDKKLVQEIFRECGGHPKRVADFNIFSLAALEIPEYHKILGRNDQYIQMAERRKIAPDRVMDNYDFKAYYRSTEKFGEATAGFWNKFSEASRLGISGDHIISTDDLFDDEFENLTEAEKAELLRMMLSELHGALLFDETSNSVFTRERVESDNKIFSVSNDYGSWPGIKEGARYNPAHSMIYRTRQPVSVFNASDSFHQRNMNSTADIGGYIEEYPFHRLLLEVLRRFKVVKADSEQNVVTVLDFWNKNRNPIFGNAVSDFFSAQDPNLAAHELLKLLRSEDKDKNPFSAILHRLEFGRIGISDEGVKYLEKVYDLGEYNNPDYHVSRLTADGEIGVFNEEKELIKYFQLGDISAPEKKVRAKVLDFVYDTLFMPKENESEVERGKRIQYLEEFKKHYYEVAESEMFNQTGVRLNNLSFKEQGWFVIYFNEITDAGKKNELVNFVKKFGENGLRTFFSMEFGGQEMGEHILSLGRDLPKEAAEAIFLKYAEVTRAAREAVQYMAENIPVGTTDDNTPDNISINLLRRAKDLLVNFSSEASESKSDEQDSAKLIAKLNNVRADIMLFAVVYKESGLPIESMQDASFESVDAEQLSIEDKQRMKELVVLNYGESEFGKKVVMPALEKGMANPADKFYLLRNKNNIIGGFRIEDRGDKYYFGSFNMDPNAQASGLGNAMLEKVITSLSESKPIEANVEADKPVASYYINKLGFVIKESLPDVAGTGVNGYTIEKPQTNAAHVSEDIYSEAA